MMSSIPLNRISHGPGRVVRRDEHFRAGHVQDCSMNETFPIEFFGGSRDGAIVDAVTAPDHVAVTLNNGIQEIYERQNQEPPFVYVQIGYAENEPSK